jgi:outer membrane protein OmpA-like peptidoglycan-associated protein
MKRQLGKLIGVACFISVGLSHASEVPPKDLLDFAAGAMPVAFGAKPETLKTGFEHALSAIDGNPHGKVMMLKPGAADSEIWFVYKLPAETVFTGFAVPNVGETPSPSQTFFRDVEIAGALDGPDGPFQKLAGASLSTHSEKDEITRIPAEVEAPVRWVKLTLRGGVQVEREATYFEFSEIIGEGLQEPVPMLEAFSGTWKERGMRLELKQDGASVSGCYDGVGDLQGDVSGNLLRAAGTNRTSGVSSTFILTVNETGAVTGLRSTNGAPFKPYGGSADPSLVTECSRAVARPPGCGDIVHGIQFDYDSADIRVDSAPVLDALYTGLSAADAQSIRIVGHTSSEGSEDYNRDLSERRAQSVVSALVERGIDALRLAALGQGETQPIADNSTEAGRSLNRRVEMRCTE